MQIVLEKDEYLKLKQYVASSKEFLLNVASIIERNEEQNHRERGFIKIKEHFQYILIENVKEVDDILL